MAVANAYQRQIKNRNFLAPTGFKLVVNRSPKVAFFSNAANLPGITLGEAIQPTYLKIFQHLVIRSSLMILPLGFW